MRHNELVYPGDFVSGTDICPALNSYFHFYNFQRPHQALNYRTPAQLYLGGSHPSEGWAATRLSVRSRFIPSLRNLT